MMAPRRPIRSALQTRRRSSQGKPPAQPGPAHTLERAIHDLSATLERTARNPKTHLNTLVHEVRLATKSLRAYVRLLETAGTNSALHTISDQLRHIAFELGGARDTVVVRRTLRSLASALPGLQAGRPKHGPTGPATEPEPDRPLTRADVRRRVQALGRAGRALAREIRCSQHPRSLAQALIQLYGSVRERSKRQRGKPDPEAWHRWRKRTKAFYYQLAWLGQALPRRLRRLARRAWKLQRHLGDHHDLALVHAYLARSEPQPRNRHRHRQLIGLCSKAMRKTERRVRRGSRRFARLDLASFESLATRAFAATAR